jgi:hypothetical protein
MRLTTTCCGMAVKGMGMFGVSARKMETVTQIDKDRIPHASCIKCTKLIVQHFLADILFLWCHLGLESPCIRVNTVYVMEVVVGSVIWTTLV